LNKNSVLLIILLTLVWIILCEDFSAGTAAAGVAISAGAVYCCYRLLPLDAVTGVDFLKFSLYPFYLAGQIYLAAIAAVKIVLTGAKVEIVEIKTKIDNNFLRVILANSITLTPGTITLELKDGAITVLWLRGAGDAPGGDADELIKGKLERMLLKAQK